MLLKELGEDFAGKLGSLVRVEDVRSASPESFLQSLNTEAHVQSIGETPRDHVSAVPVHDDYQVQEAPCHGDPGDICRPDLIGLVRSCALVSPC